MMEDLTYVCPDCNCENIMNETEEGIYQKTCPNCGAVVKVLVRGGRCYCISAADYERGQNMDISGLKKKDAKMIAANGFIQAFNRFCRLSLISRIALCSAFLALVFLSVGLYLHFRPAEIKESMAYTEMDDVWKEFRSKNPYNYQTIGVRQFEDSSYLVMVSEPSDNVTPEALSSFFKKYNGKVNTKRTLLGVDGWLQDAVISLNDLNPGDFDSFITELNELVFGVSYKPYYIDLSDIPQHTSYSTHNLNLQVSAEELQSWFIQEGEPLIHCESGKQTTLVERLDSKVLSCDLYYSAIPNFVVMVLPRFWDISSSFRDITYRFTLDSDLLLGAIVSDSFVAIIGREREVPVTELPPLRVETLFTLAATHEDQLSQSYERNHIFAGKLPGCNDIAPILLSKELWHTEYGSLLNETDQMLKSWSENGLIEYEGFNYPKPIDWAFDYGALKNLNVNNLTYNWNTAGVGYEIEPSDELPYTIYAVNRTGSLPVSYIPGDTDMVADTSSIFLSEEKAYDFFSMLNNPELVRVVQYAAFYQICHNFDIELNDERNYHTIISSSMAKSMKNTLKRICTHGIDSEALETYYYDDFLDDCVSHSLFSDVQVDTNEVKAMAIEYAIDRRKTFVQKLDSIKLLIGISLDTKVQYGSGDFLTELAYIMVNPSAIYSIYNKDYVSLNLEHLCNCALTLQNSYKEILLLYGEMTDCFTLEQVMLDYIKDNETRSSLWIKCPTVVLSRVNSKDSLRMTGGHNLSSRITPIKVDKTLRPGRFRVDRINGVKTVYVSSFDRMKVTPSLLRKVERTQMSGLQRFGPRVESSVVRRPNVALSIGRERPERLVRGFDKSKQVARIAKVETGFELNGKKFSSVDDLFENMATLIEGDVREFRFENISSHDASCIIKGTESVISRSPSRFKLADFDIRSPHVVHKDGVTIVRIQSKPKAFLSTESVGNGHIQTAVLEFRVPTSMFERFMKALREFFRDPRGTLNRLHLHRQLKQNGIDPSEILEFEEYKIASLRQSYQHLNIS